MKQSIKKLRIALQICDAYKGKKSKFGYACLRNSDKIRAALKHENEILEDKRVELASVDKDKNLLVNDKGGHVFTAEATKQFSKFANEQGEKEIEYEGYIASDYNEISQSIDLIDALNGIVVNVDIEAYVEAKELQPA